LKYIDWFIAHAKKHRAIVASLEGRSDEEIVEYFDYDKMRRNEPDFCPLYAKSSKCHDMKNLNCYMCGCPHFRFDDSGIEIKDGRVVYSYCVKNLGDKFVSDSTIHHDCSNCTLPHTKKFAKDNFSLDWFEIMDSVFKK